MPSSEAKGSSKRPARLPLHHLGITPLKDKNRKRSPMDTKHSCSAFLVEILTEWTARNTAKPTWNNFNHIRTAYELHYRFHSALLLLSWHLLYVFQALPLAKLKFPPLLREDERVFWLHSFMAHATLSSVHRKLQTI